MSKRGFNIYLGVLIALILFSVSPFAFLGGLLVAIGLVVPAGIVLMPMGVLGQDFENALISIFWGTSALLGLIAFVLFYRAAGRADKGEDRSARTLSAIALTFLVIPVLIFFFYQSLPGI